MLDNRARTLRIAIAIACVWAAAAAAAWFMIDPAAALVGARAPGIRLADAGLLERPDLSREQAVLEKTLVWGMQRDGQPVAPKVEVSKIEIKIVWRVVATVVRPKERYLLVHDQGSKVITQINEGDKLPDGSTLLKVALSSYSVRAADGKKRTVETNL